MKSEFILAFNQICSERGLPPEIVMEALGMALVTAFRRNTNISSAQNVTVEIDQDSGQAAIFIEKEVVEHVHSEDTEVQLKVARKIDPDAQLGDTIMVESTPKDFGRIAAQTAKQVILQRIREAEREALYEDYAGREGEIINGVIQSITNQHISINLGRTEAILPRKEQVRTDNYTLHQRLRAYVVEVRRSGRGPQIIVSRSHKNMLRRLLELEVPEIYNGAVEIKSIAREAGARSKVAVTARQPGIDPVGSCVGMRGVRIQSIVNELGGEKIDVIEWSPDPPVFIAKALSPARVLTVHLEESPEDGRTATVVVPDDQLSLAIGREGQNARLAAKLTNWRIDIKSVTEAAREVLEMTADEQVRAELGNVAQLLPTVAGLLQYRNETNNDYNTEQQLLLRQVIDQVYNYFAAKRRAARESLLEKAPGRVAVEAVGAQRRAAREEALAQIPANAYDIPLKALALSSRVHNHLAKARIKNLGQIMERMVGGDEGLLALEGIGPKALAEIKTQVEKMAPPMPEEPPAEAVAVAKPEAAPEEVLEDAEQAPVEEVIAPEAPEIVAEAEVEMPEAVRAEAEPVQPPAAPPEPDLRTIQAEEAQRRAAREEALARIPPDAYDIPLEVLALDDQVRGYLRKAQIENLGQVMERLVDGDEAMLALEGIDPETLAEIKSQVEMLVAVPAAAPRARDTAAPRLPRYEYVADEELEERIKPKRQKRKKRRQVLDADDDADDATSRQRHRTSHDDWDAIDN